MRLFTLLALAVTAVFASPLALINNINMTVAGSVTIANGSTYDTVVTKYTIAWPTDVSSKYELRPISFKVNEGFHCIYYTESTRGIGSPIGDFVGPISGAFNTQWIMFYKCSATVVSAPGPIEKASTASGSIPCGFVVDDVFGQQSLLNTGYRPIRLANFAVSGVQYAPKSFHIDEYCSCWFYSAHNERGGAERLSKGDGPLAGMFSGTPTTRYACWVK